jgi:hypothetical protein
MGEQNVLLYPNYIGKVYPSPRILDGLVCAILPEERSVLLHEAF